MMASTSTLFHHPSPFFHPTRVKEVGREKAQYIKENNNSLYLLLSFTPTPARNACTREYACV